MVSSSTTYTIVRSYIRFGKGEWERREVVGGSWGPEFVLDRSMVECVCGLWFVNEQVGLVRMRRCVIEPCPALTFSLRTLLSSSSRCCLPPRPPRALRFPSPDRRCEK